ncbi:hydantoinase/oxoprolinase N-terminal domain-containing protein [Enterococcus sp. DIV1420a]|uniref:hydantoinase/oxoprolinase N-terminal domain-containing protein n=1 Tax=Enterococcus sp. DIV1420a TaxID=2774672 RepID=UPI003F26DD8E
MYKIGIDVGGTNTDAVIIDEKLELVHGVKVPTSGDIQAGIENALHKVMSESEISPSKISYAMLGTTQCTNAIVERKKLSKVGVIRLGYPATASVKPYTAWPEDMIAVLGEKYELLQGGYEYDGQILSEIEEDEVKAVLAKWKNEIESLAVVGVFSSLKNDQELLVEKWAKEILGDAVPVSCSSQIGSVGLLERENATILNAALDKVMKLTSSGFERALKNEGIKNAEVYLCQNDGTLMSIAYAKRFPILTIACGPTNSIRGASYLAKVKNAIVLDVGGTTSDLGVLADGFPRESSLAVDVGGIRTNFRMPDIVSIGLGGGSIVRLAGDKVTIGPDSVGYRITEEALVFGGNQLTATDIAVRLGLADIGNRSLVEDVPIEFAKRAYEEIRRMTEEAIDKMKTSSGAVDLILVGGGAVIIPKDLNGVENVYHNTHGGVANAIGASIAQISGQYEQIYIYSQLSRQESLEDAKQKASHQAKLAGAIEETIELVEVEETPLAYHPENATRLRVKVVGNMG